MKKLIFGLMLLVSMLGIVGCSMDSSDSTSDPVPEIPTEEEIVYTIKNESGVDVIFYYESDEGTGPITAISIFNDEYTIEKCKSIEIAKDDSCTIKKQDCKITKDVGQDVIQFAVNYDTKYTFSCLPLVMVEIGCVLTIDERLDVSYPYVDLQ